MIKSNSLCLAAAALTLGAVATTAPASFHVMQIEQVIGGVNGDTTAQAIQLRMRLDFQNQLQFGRLMAYDAAGLNPVLLVDMTTAVGSATAGDRILIASPNFISATSPATVPDFTMTGLIPGSYLAAGSLTFENDLGTLIVWRVSWGGGAYTGDTTGSTFNDLDGQYGPPWPGPMPSGDLQALLFQGPHSAGSSNNEADYALTGGAAEFTNNGGDGFTVDPALPCPGDCAQPPDGDVNIVDFFQLIAEWGLVGSPCDLGAGIPGVSTADFFQLIGEWGLCP